MNHMLKNIEFSIKKTMLRIKEFEGDSENSKKILDTLSALNIMKRLLTDFRDHNETLFKGK